MKGANPNEKDPESNEPVLILAYQKDKIGIFERLIQAGADPNISLNYSFLIEDSIGQSGMFQAFLAILNSPKFDRTTVLAKKIIYTAVSYSQTSKFFSRGFTCALLVAGLTGVESVGVAKEKKSFRSSLPEAPNRIVR